MNKNKLENFIAQCKEFGIETDITKRWETGIPHHPKSQSLIEQLSDVDFLFCGDYFCWKYGGDGDNGETLAFEMDIIFELEDKIREANKVNI